jgi:hypothetical protein
VNLSLVAHDASGGTHPVSVDVREVVLAGYTGRDRARVMQHIEELERNGVPAPASVPVSFVVPATLLTTDGSIRVTAERTSGEAEFVVFSTPEGRFIGVGSDHTDRDLEQVDIDRSKAVCAKPLSRDIWWERDVREQWDDIELRSWSVEDGQRHVYQEGRLGEFLALDNLADELARMGLPERSGRVLFSGTLPLKNGRFRYADRFEAELHDPRRNRSLRVAYDVRCAP